MSSEIKDIRVIKKYPNRRLYDTHISSYVSLIDVKSLITKQVAVKIVDSKTKEDITRNTLFQILLEEEAAGMPVFSTPILVKMIQLYNGTKHSMMGQYLDAAFKTFYEMELLLNEKVQPFQVMPKSGEGELWQGFLNWQGPAMNLMMQTYVDQVNQLFSQSPQVDEHEK